MGTQSNEARASTIAVERVEDDTLCVECEQNLRTLPLEAACPECGYSVDESVRAVGHWSRARIVRLRMAAIAFAVATLAWGGFAAVISGLTCPPRTDPSAMRVPTGPGWALETLDETDTTHP